MTDPFPASRIFGASIISVHSMFYSSRNKFKGFITAVDLWGSVIIGISLGLRFYIFALTSYAALLCILFWFPLLKFAFSNCSKHFELHLDLTSNVCLQDFVTVIRRLGLKIDEIEQNPAYVGKASQSIPFPSLSPARCSEKTKHMQRSSRRSDPSFIYNIFKKCGHNRREVEL